MFLKNKREDKNTKTKPYSAINQPLKTLKPKEIMLLDQEITRKDVINHNHLHHYLPLFLSPFL
jgi:hypothetical protein